MKNIKNKKGFSLIELSIVLLIIGIIVAGITQSSRLIAQFKLSSARGITQSSPVSSIKDLVTWLESTSLSSFPEAQADNATEILTWYDINPATSTKYSATGSTTTTPYYTTNCINSLPCVRFTGSSSQFMTIGTTAITVPPIAGNDYTIFVVEQKRSSTANYFIGGSTSVAGNRITMGHASDTVTAFNNGIALGTTSATDNLTISGLAAYVTSVGVIHNVVVSGTSGSYYRNNKTTAGATGTITALSTSGFTSLQLGRTNIAATGSTNATYYTGDLCEVIIYARALKTEERQAVMDYLSKKWAITIS